jgi:uncharacterized membrane protein YccC
MSQGTAPPSPLPKWPTFESVLFSLKMFLAIMLAYWIALRFNLERPYWAVGTVILVSHPLSGASTSKGFYRVIGTVIGGLACLAAVSFMVQSPEILTIFVALWCGFCLFISLLDRTPRSYAFMLSGYTVALTAFSVVSHPMQAFDLVSARVVEITLGVICAALISRVVLPRHVGPILAARVHGWLNNTGMLIADTLRGEADAARLASERRRLAADAVDIRQFTTHIAYDTSHHRELIHSARALQQHMVTLLPLLSALEAQHAELIAARAESPGANQDDAMRLGNLLADVADWVMSEKIPDAEKTAYLQAEVDALEADHAQAFEWADLISLNLVRRLRQLIALWQDCWVLRCVIAARPGQDLPVSRRDIAAAITRAGRPRILRDYGMAFQAGLCTALTILVFNTFWIASGWENAIFGAQLAGVMTSILAFLDDPVPSLRQSTIWIILAMFAAFGYNYMLFPFLDGYWPVIAALGLYLIPFGTLMTNPKTFLIGLTVCVNLPYMATLQSSLSLHLVSTLESNIATLLAIITAIAMTAIVRSIGAEASARRLLHMAWKRIANHASGATNAAPEQLMLQLVDILGLMAPRMAVALGAADVTSADLFRDMRVVMNIGRVKAIRRSLSRSDSLLISEILEATARFYRQRRRGASPAAVITLIDQCLAQPAGRYPQSIERDLRTALAGMRLSLAQTVAKPLPNPQPPAADTRTGMRTGTHTGTHPVAPRETIKATGAAT